MKTATSPLRLLALGFVLASAGTGVAYAQSTLTPEQLSLRVERLTELSQRSEAKLGDLQEQMLQLHQEMSRVGRQVDNRAVMDMIQQVDQLSSEISQLTGSIEEQRYEIEGIKKRQRELYADIDRRLRDLESGAAGRAASGSISVPQTSSGTSAAGQAAAAAAAGASSGEAASTTSQTTASPSAASDVERAAYQAAFDTLKEGRYKNAKVELRAFLDKYPNSSYAGNAQYWLGEANYVTRSFEQGIVEFKNVLEKYPTSNKVPDAMLKLGYTYYELKQYPEARQVLTQLRDKFPGETAASLATK
ncbi:MAG: tol-pal system protein YbgF, partial [Gammaproteobacteria bacterium]